MTDAGVTASRPESEPFQVWAESLANILGQITGSPLPCAALPQAPPELSPASESDLWIVCACSGGLRGEMSLRLPAASTLRLAQTFMSEPATPEAETTQDHREAALELMRQVAGLVTSALKARWGEVQLRLDPADGAPSWPASATAWLRAGEDPATAPLVEVHLSAALVAALRAEKADAGKPAAVVTPAPSAQTPSTHAPSAHAPSTQAPSTQDGRVNLDLLMDVELAVTLRFGSRRLPLKEVLDLNPGSVVDLDRQVQEPVDVLLDGRLVARGEVVVMDGNYGLRVTEVGPAAGL